MKQCSISTGSEASACLLLLGLLVFSPISANTIIAAGYVPEKHNLRVTLLGGNQEPRPDGAMAVAEIEIDNNLPGYELVLDFSDRYECADLVSHVRMEPAGGKLGEGLSGPDAKELSADGSCRFVWSPGRQSSATLGYKILVLVNYRPPQVETPLMMVGMSASY